MKLSRDLEKNTHNRLHQLHKKRKWKTKNANLIAKDKGFATIMGQYRKKLISHDEYVKKIIKANKKKKLPRGRRALEEFLESDSE